MFDVNQPLLFSLKPENEEYLSLLEEMSGIKGCRFCGGLGHRVTNCPKVEDKRMNAMRMGGSGQSSDFLR